MNVVIIFIISLDCSYHVNLSHDKLEMPSTYTSIELPIGKKPFQSWYHVFAVPICSTFVKRFHRINQTIVWAKNVMNCNLCVCLSVCPPPIPREHAHARPELVAIINYFTKRLVAGTFSCL